MPPREITGKIIAVGPDAEAGCASHERIMRRPSNLLADTSHEAQRAALS